MSEHWELDWTELTLAEKKILDRMKEVQGIRAKDLLASLQVPRSTLYYSLNALAQTGWVKRLGKGRWKLTSEARAIITSLAAEEKVRQEVDKSLGAGDYLKGLYRLFPTEEYRAFFRLMIDGLISKHHLWELYPSQWPSFIIGGDYQEA